jgi:predicted site-specific integrase-resolvase
MKSPQYIDNDKYERLIGISEAANILGFVPKTLREWARAKQIPSFKTPGVKGRYLVRMSEIYASLERMEEKDNNGVINSWKGLADEC